MGKLISKFIPALFASILVGMPLSAVSQNAPTAKSDCVASPGSNTPQGQHWYYRIRDGKRCWFLDADDRAKSTRTTAQKSNSSTPPRARDAHAQLASSHPDTNPDTTAPMPAQNEAQSQQVTEAAPNDADLQPTPNQSTVEQPEQLAPEQLAPEQPSPASATVATDVSAEKPTTSLQMLVLVVGGALTLAGIIVLVAYSFGGSRKPVQANPVQAKGARRRVNWGPVKANNEAPEAHAATGSRPHIKRSRPLDSTSAPTATKPAAGTTEARTPYPESSAKRPGSRSTIRSPATMPAPSETRTPATELHAKAVKPSAETEADEMDIDAITAMLERLTQDGPRLSRPSSATGSADFGQSRRARPGARA